jgi:hypothetical protein
MTDTNNKGWKFYFSTYPKDLSLSKEKIIISNKTNFNEATMEAIDSLNLDEIPINDFSHKENTACFLDQVENLDDNSFQTGKLAYLTFITNSLQSKNSYIMYPMDTINPFLVALGTDPLKKRKDSIIVRKKVNLHDHMQKLKEESKKNK